MKLYLPYMVKMVVKLSIVMLFLGIHPCIDNYEHNITNTNNEKAVQLIHEYIDYNTINKDSYSVPLFATKIITAGKQGVIAYTNNNPEPVLIKEPIDEIVENGKGNPGYFIGTMTGYGPNCKGCSGRVACKPYQNVKNGNIYYNDKEYGKIRIVAADRDIPCGTVVEISNFWLSSDPIKAVVLDRGSAIQGKIMDLLFNTESETIKVGRQRNIRYDILRWGWEN